jgi:amino acid adenylation domain-containing protein
MNPLPLNHFPVSPLQRCMIRDTLSFPQGAGIHIEQIVFKVNQDINIEQFTKAWLKIIKHHEILRLGFAWENLVQPQQYIATLDEINIEVNDWSKKSKSETDEFLAIFLQADRSLEFSLAKPPIFRMAILKTNENQYTCVWSFHHALADRNTMVCILKDLFLAYHNPETKLIPPGSFRNYILWLNRQPPNPNEKDFWEEQLKGFTAPLYLPFVLKKGPVYENRRQKQSISLTTRYHQSRISSATTADLNKFCKKNAITINFLLMGTWALLLSHYSGENNIVLGVTRSIRQWPEKGPDHTGQYTNTLPVRISIDPKETFLHFLNKIRNNWIRTKEFEHSSLSNIHLWSQAAAEYPLLDILFSYDDFSIDSALEDYKDQLSCSTVTLIDRTPGSLFLTINGIDELLCYLNYDRRLFDEKAIGQIMEHFNTCLKSVCQNFDPKLMDLSILTDMEKQEIAEGLNTFKNHTRPNSCIHHLVDIQASSNKDATAVSDLNASLTYGELNLFSNQIAHYLIKLGAMPEKKVVLLLEQDINLIAFILGVLKSGSAYVPIDPGYPGERINYIIKDCAPEIIITSKNHGHKITPNNALMIQVDEDLPQIKVMDRTSPKTQITPQNTAYIIYTSGSTGNPKGVMVAHSSLVAFTRSASEIYDIRPDDRVFQFASISVDASTEKIFPTLFSGATLIIKPRSIGHTPAQHFDFYRENHLTVLDLPTSFWHLIVDEIDILTIPEQIRLIIIGGDEVNADKVKKWHNAVTPDIRLINTYGPTETTVAVTWADLSSGVGSSKRKISIGNPFPSVSLCILNQFKQPALPGTIGELYIGGPQTSRGYLSREDLTARSFVKLKSIDNRTIFFKTGDKVEMLPGNDILLHGRIDRHIKIRGFRVESGEIEKTAIRHHMVSECAVAVSKDSVETLSPLSDTPSEKQIQLSGDNIQDPLLQRGKPPIILIGNSIGAARGYKKADLNGHPFYHAPIFIHFYAAEQNEAVSMTIPQLAQKCIADILHFHPTGPYILIGECLNSIVAHEVACQLLKMHHQVESLIIIDENWDTNGTVPVSRNQTKGMVSFLKKQTKELYEFGVLHIFKKIISRLKDKIRYYYFALDGIKGQIYTTLGKLLPEAIQFRSMENVFYKSYEFNPYTPERYSGHVILLYSENWMEKFAPKLNMFYRHDTKKVKIKARHSEWFKPEQIKTILNEIDNRC